MTTKQEEEILCPKCGSEFVEAKCRKFYAHLGGAITLKEIQDLEKNLWWKCHKCNLLWRRER